MKPILLLSSILLLVASAYAIESPHQDQSRSQEEPRLTVFMIGDSTMSDYNLAPASPIRGWGQMFAIYFKANVLVDNRAVSGYTTKACLQNKWPKLIEAIRPGDYLIIQFGHNDSKADKPGYCSAFGAYKENLERFVRETRERKGIPILATSVARRAYDENDQARDTHGDYPVATRQVCAEQNVPLLEMTLHSMDLLTQLGPERSKILFSNPAQGEFPGYKPPNATRAGDPNPAMDNTHFNAFGASRMADFAAEEIRQKIPSLAMWLKD